MAVPNYRAHEYIATLTPFKGSNLRAEKYSDNIYRVYSYAQKLLEVNAEGRITYHDETRWSQTTSKHQGYIRRGIAGRGYTADAVHLTR
jgi:hypothetical protein